jgi:hypothetical protein
MSQPIFEKYNARWLSYQEVAQTFVPPAQYRDLTADLHSVIIGPRGSGKTTLLKMLTEEALDSWTNGQAPSLRRTLSFRGVFVGSDRAWSEQLLSVGGHRIPPEYRDVIVSCAITTHVLRALLAAASFSIRRANVCLNVADEARLVRNLAETWAIRPAIPSFNALDQALGRRIVSLGQLGGQVAYAGGDAERRQLLSEGFLHLPMRPAVSSAIDYIDELLSGCDVPIKKWALLFDELEIAPSHLLHDLFMNLRSTDPRIRFKLAVSPYNPELQLDRSPDAPRPGNDYDEILLWHAKKWDSREFSRALWRKLVEGSGLTARTPEEVLGNALFDTSAEEWTQEGTAYHADSRLGHRLRELAKRDVGFLQYLGKNGIDLQHLERIGGRERAQTLRKATPIAMFRAEFLRENRAHGSRDQRLRTLRKPPAKVYSGANAVFTMLEGNPRWLIGVVRELLEEYRLTNERVRARHQTDALVRTGNRFRALLKTLPWRDTRSRHLGVLELVDFAGHFFGHGIVSEHFDADPIGTFTVDAGVDKETLAALEMALKHGAVFLLPDADTSVGISSISGKRCRLTFLLASYYGLPLRLGRSVSLSRILVATGGEQQSLLKV